MENTHQEFLHHANESPTLRMHRLSHLAQAENKTIYKLGFGASPFAPPPHIIHALRTHADKNFYTPVQGMPALREAVIKFQTHHTKTTHFKPDDVLIGAGSKILIYCMLTAFKQAHVLIPAPAWVSYEPQAHLIGHPVTRLETTFENRWRLQPEDLAKTCAALQNKTRAPLVLILNYPGNPDGQTYTDEELKALAAVGQKYNIIVITDELYGVLSHDGPYTSLAHYYPQKTVVSTGLSKFCSIGGWRLGAMLFPQELDALKKATLGVASETFSCAPTPIQHAAIEAFDNIEALAPYLQTSNTILKTLGQYYADQLNNGGVRVHTPKGAFYLFIDFSLYQTSLAKRGITTSPQLTETLMKETNVALLPGVDFGMPPESLTARLCYVDVDGHALTKATLEKGAELSPQEILSHPACAKVNPSIDAILSWVK